MLIKKTNYYSGKPSHIWICIVFILFTGLIDKIAAQSQQLKKWYMNGREIDFSSPTPQINTINSSNSNAKGAANGIYKNDGQLAFNVIDNTIYNALGNVITQFSYGPNNPLNEMGSEVAIVPVPGSCTKYYVVHVMNETQNNPPQPPGSVLFTQPSIFYTEIDMTLNNGLGGVSPGKNNILLFQNGPYNPLTTAIAISKETGNNRFMYFISQEPNPNAGNNLRTSVRRFNISSNSIGGNTVIWQSNTGTVDPAEADISPDGTMLAFSNMKWGSFSSSSPGITILHINPTTGDLNTLMGNNGVSSFNPTNLASGQYTGIEFSADNAFLYFGERNGGIRRLTIATGVVTNVIPGTNSPSYGNSQLERRYFPGNAAEHIYAAQNSNVLGYIDVSTNTFFGNFVSFNTNAVIRHQAQTIQMVYTLPDQIDGEDYDAKYQNNTLECCQSLINFDKFSYTAQTGIQIWTSTSNPINNGTSNTVYIKDNITIPAGSNITIQGMVFHFAPNANVIVERGTSTLPGGKLTLDGTTLTYDGRCGLGDMWNGVQIY